MSNVNITSKHPVTISSCEIIGATATAIKFKHKKPRSKKYLVSTLTKEDVISYMPGDEGEFNGEVVAHRRVDICNVTGGIKTNEDGMIVVVDEGGYETTFMNLEGLDVTMVSEDDDGGGGKTKKKASKKKRRSKKVEEEEEEWEDEGDEEEEEEEEWEDEGDEEEEEEEEDWEDEGDEEEDDWGDEEDDDDWEDDDEEEEEPVKPKRKPGRPKGSKNKKKATKKKASKKKRKSKKSRWG